MQSLTKNLFTFIPCRARNKSKVSLNTFFTKKVDYLFNIATVFSTDEPAPSIFTI